MGDGNPKYMANISRNSTRGQLTYGRYGTRTHASQRVPRGQQVTPTCVNRVGEMPPRGESPAGPPHGPPINYT
eukprot:462017-Prymnesium_polylepis.1